MTFVVIRIPRVEYTDPQVNSNFILYKISCIHQNIDDSQSHLSLYPTEFKQNHVIMYHLDLVEVSTNKMIFRKQGNDSYFIFMTFYISTSTKKIIQIT